MNDPYAASPIDYGQRVPTCINVRDESRAPSSTGPSHVALESDGAPSHDALASGTGPERPQKSTRNRSRVKGGPEALGLVLIRHGALQEALRAVQWAREARSAAVKAALEAGWSVRGLAEALEVDKSWVQRVAAGD